MLDSFAHASRGLRLSSQMSVAQIGREVFLAPTPDAARRIRGDVGRVPGPDLRARQCAAGLLLHQEAARRVTGAAMRGAFDQIGAPIPRRRLFRIGREDRRVQKQKIPAQHRQADIHRKRQLGFRCECIDRRYRLLEIEVEGVRVLVGEFRIGGVGHRGIEVGPITANAAAKRPRELRLRVASDSEIGRRRDVRRIDRSERGVDRQPAGEGQAVRRGVAGRAVGRDCQILSALDRRSVRLGRRLCRASGVGRDGYRKTD